MNFCPNCGNKLVPDANFCPNCGANLQKYRTTEPAAVPEAASQPEIPGNEHSTNELSAETSQSSVGSETHQPSQTSVSPVEDDGIESQQAESNAGVGSETIDVVTTEEAAETSEATEDAGAEASKSVLSEMTSLAARPKHQPATEMKVQPASSVARPEIHTRLVVKPQPTVPSGQLTRQLRASLNALYIQLTLTFDIPQGNGTLTTKFSRIKLRIAKKIEGYDLDELAYKVEPLCQDDHVATQEEVEFVQALINKYRNYGRTSELEKKLNLLSGQSSNAIVDADHLNQLQEYMHVDRGNLETDLLTMIEGLSTQHGKLIFLVGNVGDGKSHLIGYLKQKHRDLFREKQVKIHYDATESFDPHKTAMETLLEILQPFSDGKLATTQMNLVVAINMGILMNFIRQAKQAGDFEQVLAFLAASGITTSLTNQDKLANAQFGLLSFRDYPLFKVDATGTNSQFYDALFDKVAMQSTTNPFYQAYQMDQQHYVTRLTHHNYELFMNPKVRETLKFLLIKIQVESKVIISTRALLELIHDILVPNQLEENDVINYQESLPYLLFGGSGDSAVIKKINEFDPQKFQNQRAEELMTKIYNSRKDLQKLAEDFLGAEDAHQIEWLWDYVNVDKASFEEKLGLLLRIKYLLEREDAIFDDGPYHEYLQLLMAAATKDGRHPVNREFYKQTKQFIYDWNGSPQSNYIFTFINERKKFGVAVPFNLEFKEITEHDFNVVFQLKNADATQGHALVIDFDLFVLIKRVGQGYLLKTADRHQFVNVATFIENITKSRQTDKETLIGNIETNHYYRLTYDGMDVEMGEM
ncbi:DNA phosphorothioation-dependent restriction protein DptF [Levilactobacillus brevis]|uniref:DNA phosphorothioation-dependent restriction protein DptF n=1 Tax=Levilactobacillus brevis TaxID=1580 RepID=UPI0020CF9554|nr:DNA phosphorothioation-dependent restriction protein DptF [Levilactobacillus brevis]MCP9615216.1 DNA phosphorothioation-dependent restriction protein DptF [Levilactobacillus brevis]